MGINDILSSVQFGHDVWVRIEPRWTPRYKVPRAIEIGRASCVVGTAAHRLGTGRTQSNRLVDVVSERIAKTGR